MDKAARDLKPGDAIRLQDATRVVDRTESFRDSNGYWFLYVYFTDGEFIMKAINDTLEVVAKA